MADQQTLVGDKYAERELTFLFTVLNDFFVLCFDRFIGGFLTLSPEYCFVVEDDLGLCGYALAVLDAKKYYNKLEVSWIPELLKKYPLEECGLKNKYLNQFIEEIHKDHKQIYSDPEAIFNSYPSLLNLSVMSTIIDLSVPKRMLTCVIAALKANGLW